MRSHIDIPAEKVIVWEDKKRIVEFPFALMEHMNAGHHLDLQDAAKYEQMMYVAKKTYNDWRNHQDTTILKQLNGIWFPEQETHMLDGFNILSFENALKYVKQHRVAIDIGAHLGFASRYCMDKFQRVVAFEPNHQSFQCLLRNTSHMHNITSYKVALSNRLTEVQMEYDLTRYGNTGCFHISTQGEKYQTTTLDTYGLMEVDFIKIDVEGHELEVLQGSLRTIKNNKPVIIMEVKEGLSERHGVNFVEAPKYLESLGYKKMEDSNKDWVFVPC